MAYAIMVALIAAIMVGVITVGTYLAALDMWSLQITWRTPIAIALLLAYCVGNYLILRDIGGCETPPL